MLLLENSIELKKIATDFQFEVNTFARFLYTGFLRKQKATQKEIKAFNKMDETFIILKLLFDERKLVTIHQPFSN